MFKPRLLTPSVSFWVSFFGLVLAVFLTFSPVQSQIVADPSASGAERATVLEAGNGVPLVNIQTPSGAGVSRNRYVQFDIAPQGAILNNARGDASTQLGGWVSGNPWLAGGTARIILNEVNSSHPSQLQGYVEIAGERAQLVIANPAGIACDGCGFINAHRTTLTTGQALLHDGALTGYRVQNGSINIHGGGLDDRQSDYTELIARSVHVNADIWAQHLSVTTGTHTLSADLTQVSALDAATSNAHSPKFALDVAALGGMHARQIVLRGTEQGVGVRNAGHIGAQAGGLIVTANGRLENLGAMQAQTDAQMTLNDNLTNTGLFTQTLTNRGLIDGGHTHIQIRLLNDLGTGRMYGNHLSIQTDTLNNLAENGQGAVIAARDRLDIGARLVHNREHALIFSAGSTNDALNIGGSLDADDYATGRASLVRNESASIESLGGLTLNTAQLHNLNPGFASERVQISGPTHYTYIQPEGDSYRYDRSEFRWQDWSKAGLLVHIATGREVKNWTQFEVTRSEYETQVKQSDPALIRSGGNMTLLGADLLNDKSHIIAGGLLGGELDNLTNIAALGEHIIHEEGSAYFTWAYKRGKPHKSHKRKEGDRWAYTPADTIYTTDLNITKLLQNTSGSNSGSSPDPLQPHNVDFNNALVEIDAVRTISLNPDIPASSLFRTAANTQTWLIETDSRFANYRTWLSSDYLLNQLGHDASTVHKRLGDGFYEQQLVRDQIARLTGQRFLTGHADDESQYRALLEAGSTFARQWNLAPGVALSAAQMAQLTSDMVWLVEQTVTLTDGSTQTAWVPQVYVRVQPGDLNGNGTLIAADRLNLNLQNTLTNSATLAARNTLQIHSHALRNLNGRMTGSDVYLNVAQDIDNIGGTLDATHTLLLQAGRNLTIASTTRSDAKAADQSSFSHTHLDRRASVYVTGTNVDTGTLIATAGQDMTLTAVTLHNATANGTTQLLVGHNLTLNTLDVSEQENLIQDANNHLKQGRTQEIGSQVSTQGNLTLQAGNHLLARAANVTAQTGALAVVANGDITIEAGEISHNWIEGHKYVSSKSLLKSKTTTTRASLFETTALASTFSGHSVTLQGNNITLTGSNIVADAQTRLFAQHDLTIEAATETFAQSHYKRIDTKGLLTGGGLGFTLGKQMQSVGQMDTFTRAAASTIASLQGDVLLAAGKHYEQTGSQLLAPQGNIDVLAQNIRILEARETGSSSEQHTFKQSGLSVSLSAPVISVLQAGVNMAKKARQNNDPRMQALAGISVGMSAANAYSAIQSPAGGAGASISLSITAGSSKSDSKTTTTYDQAYGSTLNAGGNLNLIAAGLPDSTLLIQGSQLNAAGDLHLQSEGSINLLAAQNTLNVDRKSSSTRGGVGVGVTFGQDGPALGMTANASAAKGKGQGRDATWRNTYIHAGQSLTLQSGGDTNLIGALASGHQILADIGGNLSLQSLQDTHRFKSEDKSIGGSATAGLGFAGSAHIGQQKINADYVSVTEQTGLQAGDGGFQIQVGGQTNLVGAGIVSTLHAAQNGLNSLLTDTFNYSDLRNHARYTASSVNLGGGFSVSANKPQTENQTENQAGSQWMRMADSARFMPGIAVPQKGNASNITRSGISDGTLTVRNGSTDIARGIKSLQQDGLQTIFDLDKITANMELGQLAGQVAFTVVGDIALSLQRDAVQRKQAAQHRFDEAKQHNDAAGMDAAWADMQKADKDFAAWADGSAYKTMLHLAAGGLQAGFGGGNALAGALGAGVGEWVAGQTGNSLLSLGASLAAGHASGSAGAGMTTAIYGDAYNRQLHAGEQAILSSLIKQQGNDSVILNAIACDAVQCWQGGEPSVMNSYVKERTAQVLAELEPGEQEFWLDLMRAQAPGSNYFEYGTGDYFSDLWIDNGIADKLSWLGNTALDFTPVVGDIKGFVEAESWIDYGFATLGVVPLGGDVVKQIGKGVGGKTAVNSAISPALKFDPYHPDVVAARIKPPYLANQAHNTRSPLFNPNKTPEPFDAQQVYQNSTLGVLGTWYGRNSKGQIYRFFYDNAGGAHFSGIVGKHEVPTFILGDWGMRK